MNTRTSKSVASLVHIHTLVGNNVNYCGNTVAEAQIRLNLPSVRVFTNSKSPLKAIKYVPFVQIVVLKRRSLTNMTAVYVFV